MKTKKYEYLHGEAAAFSLLVAGKELSVIFTGGRTFPFVGKPSLKTSDPALQEAIEGLSIYGTEIQGHVVIEEERAQEDDSLEKGEGATSKIFADVTKVQEAREILVDMYDVKISDLPNKVAILAKSAELNVLFPNIS